MRGSHLGWKECVGRAAMRGWVLAAVCWAGAWGMALGRGRAAEPAVTRHFGLANASAAVALGTNWIAVASDEDNRLRIFRVDREGGAQSSLDVGHFLELRGRNEESDIEGAARVGDRVYWLGSHSRSKDGRWRANRHRLFATRIVEGAPGEFRLEPVGRPCWTLLDQMLADPKLAGVGLAEAVRSESEERGVNLEGLAATPGGGLLLGFRSPIPGGKAVLVPLKNPGAVIEGKAAEFGAPQYLALDGLGIRDMVWTGREYYLIAGRAGGGGNSRLYRWKGNGGKVRRIDGTGFKHFNPEAIVAFEREGATRLLVLSDDGHRTGTDRAFRSFWVDP